MKRISAFLLLACLLAVSASAEIQSINMTIFGMDWEVCAHAVRVSLKAVPGVDTVNVSLEKGLATVTLKPGNTTTIKQLQDAIAKNGFTMKQSEATVIGKLASNGKKLQIQVSGSNDILQLVPAQSAIIPISVEGKTVKAIGEIPEAPKGKLPDTLRYKSIEEQHWCPPCKRKRGPHG
jgi:copper chaperone CopZ